MKEIFDYSSYKISALVTAEYSTSFSSAARLLAPRVRKAIYAIYGFVRYADEIVDSFHEYPQEELLDEFEAEYYKSIEREISINPILNCFQQVVRQYNIDDYLVKAFLKSMKSDLQEKDYVNADDLKTYIYGSADVVGLMCLKVFVNGNKGEFDRLKSSAMRLGSAFQKVNFLRDLKDDTQRLNRSYFPQFDFNNITPEDKNLIIQDIEMDFKVAFSGIKSLPIDAKLGVYCAYRYYLQLLKKLKRVNSTEILNTRIRVSNPMKIIILGKSFVRYHLNMI